MKKMIPALYADLDEDLSVFSVYLRSQDIDHRIFEDRGRQVIAVAGLIQVAVVRHIYAQWRRCELSLELLEQTPPSNASIGDRLAAAWRAQPVTIMALALSVLGFAVMALEHITVLHWLTFSDFRVIGGKPVFEPAGAAFARHEYWRLLTPVFLHFGALHIVFNLLWYWELGRRLERGRGSSSALAVLLLSGAGGNILQYMAEPAVMFGGMSGVIYGVLGYLWMWNRFAGAAVIALPPGVLTFMLIWLLVCMSGIFEALGFGSIANAAHLGGLVIGLMLGAGAAFLHGPASAEKS
jgi:GlpG protein